MSEPGDPAPSIRQACGWHAGIAGAKAARSAPAKVWVGGRPPLPSVPLCTPKGPRARRQAEGGEGERGGPKATAPLALKKPASPRRGGRPEAALLQGEDVSIGGILEQEVPAGDRFIRLRACEKVQGPFCAEAEGASIAPSGSSACGSSAIAPASVASGGVRGGAPGVACHGSLPRGRAAASPFAQRESTPNMDTVGPGASRRNAGYRAHRSAISGLRIAGQRPAIPPWRGALNPPGRLNRVARERRTLCASAGASGFDSLIAHFGK